MPSQQPSKETERLLKKYGVWDLTPVERHGGIYYKRDDLYTPFGADSVNGGKVRQSIALIAEQIDAIRSRHNGTIISQTSVDSPQGAIIACVAKEFGLRAIICLGGAKPETIDRHVQMRLAKHYGAEIRVVAGLGYPAVINARIKEIVQKEGFFNIGFGMNVASSERALLETTQNQVRNLPDKLDVLVIPVGSGLQMAGILRGVQEHKKSISRIIGVQVGASRQKVIDQHMARVGVKYELIPSWIPYAKHVKQSFDGEELDEIYEAKAHLWMSENIKSEKQKIAFWIIGKRLGDIV
jgi:1-aminocyclopropane-1-carboxylate deaminase/D-cysteine desulfhydrase-like pyridoxal-dependent ACC family enzyme